MQRVPRHRFLDASRVFCAGFFLWDILHDLHGLRRGTIGQAEVLHLPVEALAVVLLLVNLHIGHRHEQTLRRIDADRARTLSALRDSFDDLVRDRFAAWGLSDAERDVALLAFRGLRIGEIAEARGTREGTVKAQLSAVFRKAGVTTRAEFMALFVDEFLDIGAASGSAEAKGGARRA